MDLPEGVSSRTVDTDRLRVHYLESGPGDGIPVVLVHGNLSTARFYEHILAGAPGRYRFIVPDMRGFGDTEPLPTDGTRGLRDWSDDVHALVRALGIERPVHLAGWSTGGGAIAMYALDHPAASLTLIDPVGPYGFGATKEDGTPFFPDYAGSGGATAAPEFVERLKAQDRSTDSPMSPRNVLRSSYWAPTHTVAPEHEEMLLDEVFKTLIGDDCYPGNFTTSENWPGIAPGTRGLLNGLTGKYLNWSGIVDLEPKPPILWTHGTADVVIADGSAWEMGSLGKLGFIPGWPGEEIAPPQPMVGQIRAVLERYRAAGGRAEIEMFEGSGHCPPIDAQERWCEVFFGFLASVE
jgi:pimeloyl-ACP methyl ester carboxylesterase